jgi:hypothetical protein
MLVIQIDPVGPESPQAAFDGLPDHFWTAIQDEALILGVTHPELRRDDDAIPDRPQSLPDEFLVVGDGAIGVDARVAFRRVEELIPQFLGLTNSP